MAHLLLKFPNKKFLTSDESTEIPQAGQTIPIMDEFYRVYSVSICEPYTTGYDAIVTLFISNHGVVSPKQAVSFDDLPYDIPLIVGISSDSDF
jgi:hypothetical protein